MEALREREFRQCFTGQAVSLFGDASTPFALAWAGLDLTGSACDLGLVIAAKTAPLVIFLLVGGVFADCLPPRGVMLGADPSGKHRVVTAVAYVRAVVGDTWSSRSLADRFADDAYATVKGYVRTFVMHHQLLEHLPAPPARVLDVGGGAGHQSFPLAEAGYDVTLLDSSSAMLDKARQRLHRLPDEVQQRVALLEADGQNADEAVHGERFAAVLCHGVLGYLQQANAMVDQICRCAAPGGLISILTGNADTGAVRPALERRWEDALASFDTR